MVGGVKLSDEGEHFQTSPGRGIYVNGDEGRTKHLVTNENYQDIRAHIEFMVPEGSNSGVYFMGRYEIQIRDSFNKDSHYPGNECGGIYQRWDENRTPKGFQGHSPDVDAARPPGKWQWFEVEFRTPRFISDDHKIENARFVKVYHNGYRIHDNVELTGPTRASLFQDEQPTGPLMLQGDHGPVAYRNIWITPIDVNPFFAMDTGTQDEEHQTIAQQVKLLHDLGYDGMDHTGVENLDDCLDVLDRYGMRLYAVYLDVWANQDTVRFNKGLEQAVQKLANRDVTLWVPIRSDDFSPSEHIADSSAVKVVNAIADLAEPAGLNVALYPHHGFLMQTIDDALRIAQKVNRPDVGVTFNLCHWLRNGGGDINSTLQRARPFLSMVTINGADHEGDWDRLIQALGRGEYEVSKVLHVLQQFDYHGPIGLQGYGIDTPAADNLEQSITAWRNMNQQLLSQ